MVSKPNSKQTCKIENRVKTKQREKNNNKKSKAYLASPAQPTSRPSSPPWPAQPASALPVVFLLGTVGQRRVAGARAHAPEPPPACRPAPDRLRMPRTPSGLSQLPPVLIPSSCSPSRSAPRTRAEPPPPTPIAAATVLPTPHRRPRELRLDPLLPPHRPTALRKPCNAVTIAVPSPATEAPLRRFAGPRASPASPAAPEEPR